LKSPAPPDAASPGAGGPPPTTWRARLALLAGALVFSLLLGEGALRIVEAIRGPLARDPLASSANDVKRGHPVLDYEYVPGMTGQPIPWPEHPNGKIHVHINNLGLRMDRDVTREKPPGTFRILALGDSQTAGIVDNPESWPNRLETILRDQRGASGAPVEVLNAGVTGYRPMQEYLRWRLEGRSLAPDLVVLGYYVGNDFFDTARGRLARDASGAWTLDESPRALPGPQGWERVIAHTRLYAVAVAPFRRSAFEGFDKGPSSLDVPEFRAKYSALYLRSRRECVGCFSQSLLQAHLLLVGNTAERADDAAATRELMRRMRDETREQGSRFVLLLIPSKLQIEGDASGRSDKMAKEMALPPDHLPFENEVRTELLAIGADLGIDVLDPLEPLKTARAATGKPFFYDEDWHLNVAGNDVFAGIVAGELARLPGVLGEQPAASVPPASN
jgi:hypothetical protein